MTEGFWFIVDFSHSDDVWKDLDFWSSQPVNMDIMDFWVDYELQAVWFKVTLS